MWCGQAEGWIGDVVRAVGGGNVCKREEEGGGGGNDRRRKGEEAAEVKWKVATDILGECGLQLF